ncbi:uncharacterized protein PITG_12866 [Phytophthora infestans T30-4]|uniref:Uncharacterized protein n=1 Tax=Phytophthora infestans (strain T30-4) TaxID=403677 RepID=D0NLC1_PHYIT|nr:uncharacterized protein PITG_12866 [Phytophthora infestans T30-4]EEY60439.1 conserved hypothetical protein [Phytophthora infestans T30-4]|eukprot:XP_002900235.1 conserved hypothetical protein [Phytophthora infestans T30-4]
MGTAVYAEYALEEITLKSSRKQRAPTTGGAEHTSARWTRSRSLRSGKGRPSSAQGGGFEWCEWWIERGRSRRGTTTSSSKAQGRLQGVKGRRGGEHEGAGKPSDRGSNGYAGQRAGGKPYKNPLTRPGGGRNASGTRSIQVIHIYSILHFLQTPLCSFQNIGSKTQCADVEKAFDLAVLNSKEASEQTALFRKS